MDIDEKIAICYTCCGPTYRKSVLKLLKNYYPENKNLFYCIITDNKEFFQELNIKNLIINEVKDFYKEFPLSEKYEPIISVDSPLEYSKIFMEKDYKFPYSIMRYHLKQIENLDILNVAFLSTDTVFDLENYITHKDIIQKEKNTIYNTVSIWIESNKNTLGKVIDNRLKEDFNINLGDEEFFVYDEAGRFINFKDSKTQIELFNIWNDLIFALYKNNEIGSFKGWYVIHDEVLLGALYKILKINKPLNESVSGKILKTNHIPEIERFWMFNNEGNINNNKMFNKERLTRKTDLIKNDSLTEYDGYASQQNPKSFEIFYQFLDKVKPSQILEIGTGLGGLTMGLNSMIKELNLNTKLVSYDIKKIQIREDILNKLDIRIENIFNKEYTEVKKEIIDFIQSPGITIVLCDGGNKAKEFNLLSNYLKSDDYILAHDYSPNFEYFKNNMVHKVWNWMEIQDSDVEESIKKNNLIPFMQESFIQAAWLCKQKF